jgi:cell division GTPase FtsZ
MAPSPAPLLNLLTCTGAGGNPEQGRLAAEESQSELDQIAEDTDMVSANLLPS